MFDLQTYTLIHVLISLAALFTGLPLLFGWKAGKALPGLAVTTVVLLLLTSATGFGFPFIKFLPSHAFGILSLLLLTLTVYARWGRQLAGGWRSAYGATLATAIYLDAFVALVQAFLKIPALHALVPSDKSPGFALGQGLLLVVFLALGITAVRGLRRAA
ncbi:MAG: hypothetical protein EPN60_00790 [Nevskiaceae bacterium]|nr:MAG: hypothetical protein EPO48_06245 [Nevskiaceae bacterium]TAM33729.1 MAG: hypothetical protein EPN60_00790 [Nevskiaceae bacterium]